MGIEKRKKNTIYTIRGNTELDLLIFDSPVVCSAELIKRQKISLIM